MLVREGWIRHKHGLASVKIALSQAPGHVGWAPGSTHLYMRIRHGSRSVRGLIWHQGTGGRGGGKAPEGPLGPPLAPQGDLGRAQGRGPGTALAACMQRLSSFRLFPTPFARFTRCRCAARGDFRHPWIPSPPPPPSPLLSSLFPPPSSPRRSLEDGDQGHHGSPWGTKASPRSPGSLEDALGRLRLFLLFYVTF